LSLPFLAPFVLALAALPQDEPPYRAEPFVAVDRVAPGGTFRIAARLEIEPGWHTQSHKPSDPAFIATTLELAKDSGFTLRDAIYPPGKEVNLPAIGGKLSVYEGTVFLGATVEAAKGLAAGPAKARGTLRVQACDDKSCLAPELLPLEFAIEIGPGEAKTRHAEIFSKISFSSPPAPTGGGGGPEGGAEEGLLATLLSIFLLGLALNLTPCVYPVIAVTIGFFGRQAKSGGSRFFLPLCYAAGIAVTFTALGVVAALTGGAFGGLLQNRWVLLGLAALIAAFALSCFGLFEMNAPIWLLSRLGGGKAGPAGALLMGLTMGVTAAPCVGPLILTLILAVATEQSVTKGLVWFGTLSAGLALPYVFLGAFSGSVASLPKAGDWTDWVKKLLGFILLGVALWFANPLLPSEWLLPGLALISGAAGIWLAVFEKTGRGSRALWATRIAVLLVGVVGAGCLYVRSRAEGLVWREYEPRLLAEAAAARRPVFIDVTAKWCVPCRKMEETTFKDERVIEKARALILLRVDVTDTGNPSESVREAFERFGADMRGKKRLDPPQLIFLDAEGKEIPSLRAGRDLDAEELLDRMEKALTPRQ
jgi:thioredoxin:protein disulfide reductase